MTDKQLKKLKKAELLEILVYMREELDKLKSENETLKKKLEDNYKSNFSSEDITNIMNAVQKILSN